jgi:D-3-phosphoglycerate dehydrogenase
MTKTSLDKDKIKIILLLEGIHPSAAEKFQADGYRNIEYHQKALRPAGLESAAADAYFVGIRSATQLGREFFESASRLTGVGCFCIGTNQVDLLAAEEWHPVFNALFQHAKLLNWVLAEILPLRGIPHAMRRTREG